MPLKLLQNLLTLLLALGINPVNLALVLELELLLLELGLNNMVWLIWLPPFSRHFNLALKEFYTHIKLPIRSGGALCGSLLCYIHFHM